MVKKSKMNYWKEYYEAAKKRKEKEENENEASAERYYSDTEATSYTETLEKARKLK